MKRFVSSLLAFAALAGSADASAQKWVPSGVTQLSSGMEGGGGREQSLGRARTRARIGADLYVDESPDDVFGAAILLDAEPRTAFGVDGRYTRVVNKFAFSGGVIAYLQPGTLVGPVAAVEYRHPLSKSFWITAGPEANVFVFGVDLPDKTILWQALFHVGARVAF